MENWLLIENEVKLDNRLNETLFNLANGYLGIRGNYEEGTPEDGKTLRGAYINAFYETEEITYGEKLHAFPNNSQSILNVIDAQTIELYIEGEKFSLFEGEILDYKRTLNFKEGTLTREIHWKSLKGKEVKIKINRIVSFTTKELFIVEYTVESLNFDGEIKLISTVNGDVSNIVSEDDPRVGTANAKALEVVEIENKDNISYIADKTKNSDLTVVCGISHKISNEFVEKVTKSDAEISHEFMINIKQSEKLILTKYAVYTDTRRHEDEISENMKIMKEILKKDFVQIEMEQKTYLTNFWNNSDVEIEGDEKLQQGIRYNLFNLLQSVGRDRCSNIAAKGLSGEGYEGHYFWDTEIYIFPMFLFTNPEIAKNLLNYRYGILDFARKRAKEMGHEKGALYPWRTIAGDECSPFFPAGTAQYHINPDVAYSIIQYHTVTEDLEYIAEKGLEVLLEISRCMYDMGHFGRDDQFRIDSVTGPDEYTCVVNNNYYTNVMTKNLFKNTVKLYNLVKEKFPEKLEILNGKIKLNKNEIDEFETAGEKMYLPYDKDLKIQPQDDSFLNKDVWNFENTPKEKYPLLLNYHPLTLYRYQVCKQADVLLGNFLMEEESDIEVIENNFNYYEKITTHDSSLSTCIFSIMANRIGKPKVAYDYFMNTARLDLDNLHHNTKDGIHTACMGGTWMSTVFGFAGIRIIGDKLHFRPVLPENWNKLTFKIQFKGRTLKIILSQNSMEVSLMDGKEIEIYIDGKSRKLSKNQLFDNLFNNETKKSNGFMGDEIKSSNTYVV